MSDDAFIWKPWVLDENQVKLPQETILDIKEPPCKHCYYFEPKRKYRVRNETQVIVDGIKICNKLGDMEYDFSCWRPKKDSPLFSENEEDLKSLRGH